MTYHTKISLLIAAVIGTILAGLSFVSCKRDNVPYDSGHLAEFHILTEGVENTDLPNDQLALFVDYSNCIAKGMSSPFYQKMVSPLTAATKEYWSIKGKDIQKEDGKVFELLNNVKEEDYAALDNAINQMAERNGESVMLTDGELFTQTATKNNPNNPYMHAAFKKWLLKGHDIHIIAEPYQEVYKGQTFNKKRFYIIFTDDRIEGNIYSRISEVVNLEDFPQIDEFHLSGNYPYPLPVKGSTTSKPNEVLAATVQGYGPIPMEIQDWQIGWKQISNLIMYASDENGNQLPNGDKLIGGLTINKNAFGCYRIKDIEVKVYNITAEYDSIYTEIANGQKVGFTEIDPLEMTSFITYDADEFKRHGNVDLYFDTSNPEFNPQIYLDGDPYNFFKIEIKIKDLENILGNNIEIFNFDSIVQSGSTNESISESLKNCVFDPELLKQLNGKTLYTIYVKSDKY